MLTLSTVLRIPYTRSWLMLHTILFINKDGLKLYMLEFLCKRRICVYMNRSFDHKQVVGYLLILSSLTQCEDSCICLLCWETACQSLQRTPPLQNRSFHKKSKFENSHLTNRGSKHSIYRITFARLIS